MNEFLFHTEEQKRLEANSKKVIPLEQWGPYLSERQWGTVREDYSADGDAWNYFPHDHARSKAYRWGEDGIAGISDYNQYLCFALAVWNHRDPILKERLFGLTNKEGNHGEDCKELYYFLENTPTHSYMRMLYKYPHDAFPYEELVKVNAQRGKLEPEYELLDTGIFEHNRYFDIYAEYAKIDSSDIMIRITVINRGEETAELTVMPTLWCRNYWTYHPLPKPVIYPDSNEHGQFLKADHPRLGDYYFYFSHSADKILFTENETNQERLYGEPNLQPYVKDAFHEVIVNGDTRLLSEKTEGTKAAIVYKLKVRGKDRQEIYFRLSAGEVTGAPLEEPNKIFEQRLHEVVDFAKCIAPASADRDLTVILRQAFAGLLWNKQFYYYDVDVWLSGDKLLPPPPAERLEGRNKDWAFLINRDIILMPDTWEYPWYAAWDLAFHCIPMAFVDPLFAKHQMILLLREWYMNPMGQLPAYEWNFSDVNPPVHAWASLNIYRIEKAVHGRADVNFLKRVFQKLLINFTWWVNRKDRDGNNIFEGGFLGLDNIGAIDRNDVPEGFTMEQVDGTSWMAMYALNMMDIALEIAKTDDTFEDVATKFYEHFVLISCSLNEAHLWSTEDEFFYDVLISTDKTVHPIQVRSVVGLSVLFGVSVISEETLSALKDFEKRTEWFRKYRTSRNMYMPNEERRDGQAILLSLVNRDKLEKILRVMLDENEFLAPGGIRSLSKFHEANPRDYIHNGKHFHIGYDPAESTSDMFGGNSNWRGPVWMPINYLLVKSLKKYHQFYGDQFKMEFPTGSGNWMNLGEISQQISNRIINMFRKDVMGKRPIHNNHAEFYSRPENMELVLFYEYFHGDSSRGMGASHQTGWTALVAELINDDAWEWE
jgi:Glycosyl hydrolase family 63 C-terminal domain